MAKIESLSARQVEVLQWVADGSPEGRWPEGDYTYKTTCYGLSNRRLVTVDRRQAYWNATITDAGIYYIEHQQFPEGHFDLGRFAKAASSAKPIKRDCPEFG